MTPATDGGASSMQPPNDMSPGQSDLRYILHSDNRVTVDVGMFRVWPTGVEFTAAVQLSPELVADGPSYSWLNGGRESQAAQDNQGNTATYGPTTKRGADPYDLFDGLEIGVRTPRAEPCWCSPNHGCRGYTSLTVHYNGGAGSLGEGSYQWWLTPLPLDGLLLSCRWRGQVIESPWFAIDVADLERAASRAEPIA